MKYPIALKKVVHNAKYIANRIGRGAYIQLDWSRYYNNFGDILNPIIVGGFLQKEY